MFSMESEKRKFFDGDSWIKIEIGQAGARKLKRTVSYIDRSLMIKGIAAALPRMPVDVESIWLEKQTGAASAQKLTMFRVRRHTVEVAHRKFAGLRTNACFELVLKESVGITDYWYRFEFAKSRGAIHFHALLFKDKALQRIGEVVNEALRQANLGSLMAAEDNIARALPAVFAEHLVPLAAMHPAGDVRSIPAAECNMQWYKTRVAVANGEASPDVAAKVRIGPSPPCNHVGNLDCYPPPARMCWPAALGDAADQAVSGAQHARH